MNIEMIALKNLKPTTANVRHIKSDTKELQASIAAMGLLQNLIVRPNGTKGQFEVAGGERRFKALIALAKSKNPDYTMDTLVPCTIRDKEDTTEESLAENFQREALHPVDECRAFSQMQSEGKTVADIAKRFGITVHKVYQRLALAELHPAILDAFKDGELTLNECRAFTVNKDQARQLAVFDECKDMNFWGGARDAWIRRHLTEEMTGSKDGLAAFVGIEAYKAAGGTVTTDLFNDKDNTFFDNPALLAELADKKLDDIKKEVAKEGFAWVHVTPEYDWQFLRQYDTTPTVELKLTKAAKAEVKKAEKRLAELEGLDELTDEQETELDALHDQIEGLTYGHPKDVKAKTGIYLYVDHWGVLKRHEGLTKRAETVETTAEGDDIEEETKPVDPADKRYSDALRRDLRAARTQVAQAHVAQDFGMAFDLMLHQMICNHFWKSGGTLNARVERESVESSVEDLTASRAGEEMKAVREALPTDFRNEDGDICFDAVRAMTAEDKQRWFAYLVGSSVKGQLSDDQGGQKEPTPKAAFERAGQILEIDMATYFRPTSANLFDRISKAQALKIASGVFGPEWAARRSGSKKAALSDEIGRKFEAAPGDNRNTKEHQANADAWALEIMAFAKPIG